MAAFGSSHALIRIGPEILKSVDQSMRQIRRILRFVLGSTADFSLEEDVPFNRLFRRSDQYALALLGNYLIESQTAYENFDFNKVINLGLRFINSSVSNFYCTVAKDRLYCDPRESVSRKSAQTVLRHLGDSFVSSVAPILPHLAEEYFEHTKDRVCGDAFKSGFPQVPSEWKDGETSRLFHKIIHPILESMGKISVGWNLSRTTVTIQVSKNWQREMAVFQAEEASMDSELVDLLRVSEVILDTAPPDSSGDFALTVTENPAMTKCERCRRFSIRQSKDALCGRCANVIGGFSRPL